MTLTELEIWKKVKHSKIKQISNGLLIEHFNRCLSKGLLPPWALQVEEFPEDIPIADEIKDLLIKLQKKHAFDTVNVLKNYFMSENDKEEVKYAAYKEVLASVVGGPETKKYKMVESTLDTVGNEGVSEIISSYRKSEHEWYSSPVANDKIWSTIEGKKCVQKCNKTANAVKKELSIRVDVLNKIRHSKSHRKRG